MLDFAIFAVTFLLALVGAVLYLYPVTAVPALTGSGRRPHPRRAARGGPQGTGPGGGRQLPLPLCPAPGTRDASRARAAGAEGRAGREARPPSDAESSPDGGSAERARPQGPEGCFAGPASLSSPRRCGGRVRSASVAFGQ